MRRDFQTSKAEEELGNLFLVACCQEEGHNIYKERGVQVGRRSVCS